MNQVTESREIKPFEAARMIGLWDLNRVYNYLKLGKLRGVKVDGQWRVDADSVREYIAERRPRKTVIA